MNTRMTARTAEICWNSSSQTPPILSPWTGTGGVFWGCGIENYLQPFIRLKKSKSISVTSDLSTLNLRPFYPLKCSKQDPPFFLYTLYLYKRKREHYLESPFWSSTIHIVPVAGGLVGSKWWPLYGLNTPVTLFSWARLWLTSLKGRHKTSGHILHRLS